MNVPLKLIQYSYSLQVLSSTAASSAITALSPGGVLMMTGTQQAINRKCVVQLLKNYNITTV